MRTTEEIRKVAERLADYDLEYFGYHDEYARDAELCRKINDLLDEYEKKYNADIIRYEKRVKKEFRSLVSKWYDDQLKKHKNNKVYSAVLKAFRFGLDFEYKPGCIIRDDDDDDDCDEDDDE